MARYTLPSLLQGHPPSQGSGTLMSLQEGIAEPCARMVVLKPSCREPAGRRSDLPCGVTAMPRTPIFILGKLFAVPNPSIPLPLSAHTLPTASSRGSHPCRAAAPTTPPARRGEERQGRGRYVPSRHQGVRREARTGSLQEQGTYRLDPSNPTEPNHHIQPKIKTPHHSVRGSGRAADGLEGGNPERARECISAWKRFPLQTRKKPRDEVRGFWSG